MKLNKFIIGWAMAEADTFFERALSKTPLIAILRGSSIEDAVRKADRCWDADIVLVEVSLSEDSAIDGLAAVCARARDRGTLAGAGTVTTLERLDVALETGASFAIAPGLDEGVVRKADEASVPYMPGVATPSEIQAALGLGHRFLKVFPAESLGSDWLKAMRGPFPDARFVPTGGVTPRNADEFISAGAAGMGIGSALNDTDLDDLVMHLRAKSMWRPVRFDL